jgi:diguanylate cyclase (GGDEF)-like protein
VEDLEELSRKTVAEALSGGFGPMLTPEETCFPLTVGGTVVGVLGVRHAESLSVLEQESLLMATALIALTITNIQQFQEITEQGVRDSLTGCYNRRHAVERLSGELRRASRNGKPVSVLMLDLDEFKRVNDECGHASGDCVLANVGSQLRQSLRSTDIPCRYGGDEFLIILPETPGPGAEHVALSLQRGLSALSFAPEHKIAPITVSIGVAASAKDLKADAVIESADQALFAAKRAGRNQVSSSVEPDVSAAAS